MFSDSSFTTLLEYITGTIFDTPISEAFSISQSNLSPFGIAVYNDIFLSGKTRVLEDNIVPFILFLSILSIIALYELPKPSNIFISSPIENLLTLDK